MIDVYKEGFEMYADIFNRVNLQYGTYEYWMDAWWNGIK